MLPLEQFQCSSDWWWTFLVLLRKIIKHSHFLCLSPPGDWWCDVLGFLPQIVSRHLSTSVLFDFGVHFVVIITYSSFFSDDKSKVKNHRRRLQSPQVGAWSSRTEIPQGTVISQWLGDCSVFVHVCAWLFFTVYVFTLCVCVCVRVCVSECACVCVMRSVFFSFLLIWS